MRHFYDSLTADSFRHPPEYQYHILRPWFVYEYVHGADDGSQLKGALSLEWLGINAWKGCKWIGIPCGISAVSTFSDRAGTSDIGHGLMIHLDNTYSLGATYHFSSDDIGFFLTVDLLKTIQDKRSQVDGWKEKINLYLR